MKLIDRKEGKIFGVNAVDLFIIAVFLVLGYMAASTIFEDKLSFDGEEVYKAVKAYNKLEKKGFLVEAVAVGRDIGDPYGEEKEKEGIVKKAYGGTLVLKNRYGDEVTVGGSMSYLEDFAARKVELKPLYGSSVSFYFSKEEFSSFRDFLKALREIKRETEAEHVVLTGEILILNPGVKFPDFKEEAEDCFTCVWSTAQKVDENFYSSRYYLVDLGEVERLGLSSGKVTLKNFKVYLGFSDELDMEELNRVYSYLEAEGYLRDRREASYVSIEELL